MSARLSFKKRISAVLALLLSFVMICSLLPSYAHAAARYPNSDSFDLYIDDSFIGSYTADDFRSLGLLHEEPMLIYNSTGDDGFPCYICVADYVLVSDLFALDGDSSTSDSFSNGSEIHIRHYGYPTRKDSYPLLDSYYSYEGLYKYIANFTYPGPDGYSSSVSLGSVPSPVIAFRYADIYLNMLEEADPDDPYSYELLENTMHDVGYQTDNVCMVYGVNPEDVPGSLSDKCDVSNFSFGIEEVRLSSGTGELLYPPSLTDPPSPDNPDDPLPEEPEEKDNSALIERMDKFIELGKAQLESQQYTNAVLCVGCGLIIALILVSGWR